MQARGEAIPLPPLDAGYLVEWWLEIGPASGECAVSWADLAAWERYHGPLAAWEARAIRAMSKAWLAESHQARAADCPPPWSNESVPEMLTRGEKAFFAMFNQLRTAQPT